MIKYTIVLIFAFILGVELSRLARKRRREKLKEVKQFKSAKECLAFFRVKNPEGYVAFHKNGDKKDNRFNNLEIITRREMLSRIGKVKRNDESKGFTL